MVRPIAVRVSVRVQEGMASQRCCDTIQTRYAKNAYNKTSYVPRFLAVVYDLETYLYTRTDQNIEGIRSVEVPRDSFERSAISEVRNCQVEEIYPHQYLRDCSVIILLRESYAQYEWSPRCFEWFYERAM
jgi:hypothetical protein